MRILNNRDFNKKMNWGLGLFSSDMAEFENNQELVDDEFED